MQSYDVPPSACWRFKPPLDFGQNPNPWISTAGHGTTKKRSKRRGMAWDSTEEIVEWLTGNRGSKGWWDTVNKQWEAHNKATSHAIEAGRNDWSWPPEPYAEPKAVENFPSPSRCGAEPHNPETYPSSAQGRGGSSSLDGGGTASDETSASPACSRAVSGLPTLATGSDVGNVQAEGSTNSSCTTGPGGNGAHGAGRPSGLSTAIPAEAKQDVAEATEAECPRPPLWWRVGQRWWTAVRAST